MLSNATEVANKVMSFANVNPEIAELLKGKLEAMVDTSLKSYCLSLLSSLQGLNLIKYPYLPQINLASVKRPRFKSKVLKESMNFVREELEVLKRYLLHLGNLHFMATRLGDLNRDVFSGQSEALRELQVNIDEYMRKKMIKWIVLYLGNIIFKNKLVT